MKISFGNYYPTHQQYENLKKKTIQTGDFVYNITDPPINYLLRYEIKPNQIKDNKLRNSINTFNHTQAEFYSMMYNPLWLPYKISHYKESQQIFPNLPTK